MIDPKKIDSALRVIDIALGEFKRPAVMCSFGKDSLVVLHLVRLVRPDIPVIFHREAMQPHKYAFSQSVIQKWGLTVYDFPPSFTAVQAANEEFEVVNYYPIGADFCALPTGIDEPKPGESFVCGLADIYGKPTGSFHYSWDLLFHGHKSSDVDPILGAVPLEADFARNVNSASACFPLRHFTDSDIWDYIEQYELPVHDTRYEKTASGWVERKDKTHNPDYIKACVACMKPDGSKSVSCPKLNGLQVSNVYAQLRKALPNHFTYIGGQ